MKFNILYLLCLLAFPASAQEMLSREAAIEYALEHHYDIQIAEKKVEQAKNNASLLNSGYLPSLNASSNGNVTYNKGENETVQGTNTFDAAESYSYGASVNMSYVLFNGTRRYNFKQLKEQHNLSELQTRQIIESNVVQLSVAYFEIARIKEQVSILEETFSISKQRLQRAQYNYEYGQITQLEVLNAKVDVSNDSISLLNIRQEWGNAQRNLNLIMGRELETTFLVDTAVQYNLPFTKDELLEMSSERNVQIEQTNSQLRNNEWALKASRSAWLPSVSMNTGYNYNGSNNPNGAFLIGSESSGPQAGVSLTWNLFDGRTPTQIKNARIGIESQLLSKEQTAQTVKRDVLNAYNTYQNSLYILKARATNVETVTRNFERSKEMYSAGQITSIDFRQAQLNLLNARSNYSQAKYGAKNAELKLKQLAGVLLS